MSRRFFSSEPLCIGPFCLQGAEAHHLAHVMRAQVGDEVVLFDGRGDEFDAKITAVSRKAIDFNILCQRPVERELRRSIEFAVALPRGDRSDWLVQKLVELGASRLTPWQTRRSVAVPKAKTIQRLERQVIEASKQCGRNRLMTIGEPVQFVDYVNANEDAERLFAHPMLDESPIELSQDSQSKWSERINATEGKIVVGIGPEGGFSEDEVEMARQAGWHSLDLGARILRTETAAIAVAAWLMLN